MKIFVANVGVNSVDARRRHMRSPIFPDGRFEFIPIKERKQFSNCASIPTYEDIPAWNDPHKALAEYVPREYRLYRAHNDPEFTDFTYGDVFQPRSGKLTDIHPNDQLWFLARLWDYSSGHWTGASDFYFIGHLDVTRTLRIDSIELPRDIGEPDASQAKSNAHCKRWACRGGGEASLIVLGNRNNSCRFVRALRITPQIAGLIYGGKYCEEDGSYIGPDGKFLLNKNGKPRRFETFGSVTRSIQPFLDSENQQQALSVRTLGNLAAKHSSH